jgi:hypothetical protein
LGHRDRIQHPRTFTGHSDLVTSVTFLPDMPQGSSRSRFRPTAERRCPAATTRL